MARVCGSEVVMGGWIFLILLQGPFEAGNGLREMAFTDKDVAEIVERLNVVWIESERFFVIFLRRLCVTGPLLRDGQIVIEVLVVGIKLDRELKLLGRF